MARHSPTGFAFGMLLEIAAVVVIVSLLPRFDLRPPAQAEERPTPLDTQPPARLASLTTLPESAIESRPKMNSSPNLLSSEPKFASFPAPAAAEHASLAAHEVEQRLDRASQQLVNTLGTAAATWASDVQHVASRPALPPPPAPQATAPAVTAPPWFGSQRSLLPPPATKTPPRRRWLNY